MNVDFVALIYWKRSLLNGASWVSCLLTLKDGCLELVSDREVIFRWDVSSVLVRFTVSGDVIVSNFAEDSESYVLSVYANWTTPAPASGQIERLRAAEAQLIQRHRSRWVLEDLRHSLFLAGATVTGSRINGVMRLAVICGVGLVIVVAIVLAAIVVAIEGR